MVTEGGFGSGGVDAPKAYILLSHEPMNITPSATAGDESTQLPVV